MISFELVLFFHDLQYFQKGSAMSRLVNVTWPGVDAWCSKGKFHFNFVQIVPETKCHNLGVWWH